MHGSQDGAITTLLPSPFQHLAPPAEGVHRHVRDKASTDAIVEPKKGKALRKRRGLRADNAALKSHLHTLIRLCLSQPCGQQCLAVRQQHLVEAMLVASQKHLLCTHLRAIEVGITATDVGITAEQGQGMRQDFRADD
eukprot:scaffold159308_cov15-Tisochrysis_lutea.AAC.1